MVAVEYQDNNPLYMSEKDYLDFEEQSDIKHEFVRGNVYAMSGGSLRHSIITVNVSTSLNIQLVDKNCTVASPDIRLKVDAMESFRYPDASVFCGEPEYYGERIDTIKNPIVIVEILSPSTALKDRNEKLDDYLKIDTLREYILVSQHTAKVERFMWQETSSEWLYKQVIGLNAVLELPSIGCTLALNDLYKKVTLDKQ